MIVQSITHWSIAVTLNQNTTHRETMLIIRSTIRGTHTHHSRKVVNKNLCEILIVNKVDECSHLLLAIIHLTDGNAYTSSQSHNTNSLHSPCTAHQIKNSQYD